MGGEGELHPGQVGQGDPGGLAHTPVVVIEGGEEGGNVGATATPREREAGFAPGFDRVVHGGRREGVGGIIGPEKSEVLGGRGP